MTRAADSTNSASPLATSSERRTRRARTRVLARVLRSTVYAFVPLLLVAAAPMPAPTSPASKEVRQGTALSVDEAVALAFPKCQIERSTCYLTETQMERATELAGETLPSALVSRYTATLDGKPAGTAYVDTHRVRTLGETILVVVDPRDRVARVEIVAFAEPREYIPTGAWYEQFRGRKLDSALSLKGEIRGVTGASLTAGATTRAVRRVLAAHQVLAATPRSP